MSHAPAPNLAIFSPSQQPSVVSKQYYLFFLDRYQAILVDANTYPFIMGFRLRLTF